MREASEAVGSKTNRAEAEDAPMRGYTVCSFLEWLEEGEGEVDGKPFKERDFMQ